MPSGLAKGALVRLELGSGFFVPVLNLSYGGLLCSGHAGNLQQMLGGGEAAGQGQPLTGALHFGLANLSTSAASFLSFTEPNPLFRSVLSMTSRTCCCSCVPGLSVCGRHAR